MPKIANGRSARIAQILDAIDEHEREQERAKLVEERAERERRLVQAASKLDELTQQLAERDQRRIETEAAWSHASQTENEAWHAWVRFCNAPERARHLGVGVGFERYSTWLISKFSRQFEPRFELPRELRFSDEERASIQEFNRLRYEAERADNERTQVFLAREAHLREFPELANL